MDETMEANDNRTTEHSRHIPRIEKTQQGVAYITTVRTWFIDLMNIASQCTDDYQAYNAWKTLCVFANGILEEVLAKSENLSSRYQEMIANLQDEWDREQVTRTEKTELTAQERGGKRIVSATWDSYTAECFPEGQALMLEYIHKEKYNNMAARLCVWCGKCARVFFGTGLISIDHTISIPFQPSTEYDEKRLASDMEKRRMPTRLMPPQAPAPK